MRKIYTGNDYDIHRVDVSSRGALVTGISVRCHLAATPDGDPIHASLAVDPMVELSPGEYIATIEGTALTDHVKPLWDVAELAGVKCIIYERVIVDDEDYGDSVPLLVKRDRPASVPLPVVL